MERDSLLVFAVIRRGNLTSQLWEIGIKDLLVNIFGEKNPELQNTKEKMQNVSFFPNLFPRRSLIPIFPAAFCEYWQL